MSRNPEAAAQNPFQPIDEALEELDRQAPASKRLAKRAELTLRAIRERQAELLRSEKPLDHTLEDYALSLAERWQRVSERLEEQIEQLSVQLHGQSEKNALWNRFKNLVTYKEKIDAALRSGMTEEKGRELEDNPLKVYAHSQTGLESEILKHREREAEELDRHAGKIAGALHEYQEADKRVLRAAETLRADRSKLAEQDAALDQRLERAVAFMEKLQKVREDMVRIKDWVDGKDDDKEEISIATLPLCICVTRWLGLKKKEKDIENMPEKTAGEKENKRFQRIQIQAQRTALQKRLSLPFVISDFDIYKEANDLENQGVIKFNREESRIIMLIEQGRDPRPIYDWDKQGPLSEDEAKILMAMFAYLGGWLRSYKSEDEGQWWGQGGAFAAGGISQTNPSLFRALIKFRDKLWFWAALKNPIKLD